MLYYQEWGKGDPLIALHPLALESTVWAGVSEHFAGMGLRTLACDLPGFGQTPACEGPITPAALAEPIIELALRLERPPIIMGMSLGGRVALEVALTAPEAVRGVVLVAPYLPWRRYHQLNQLARYLDPEWGHRLPLEHIWPLLKLASEQLEKVPALQHDWFARACVRVAYYATCPATRVAFLSAARELALDPSMGEDGLWSKLPQLEMPASFLWAGKDRLIPRTHAGEVAKLLPDASRLKVPCSGHFVNFRHFRCMEGAIAEAVFRVLEIEAGRSQAEARRRAPCMAGDGASVEGSDSVRGAWAPYEGSTAEA